MKDKKLEELLNEAEKEIEDISGYVYWQKINEILEIIKHAYNLGKQDKEKEVREIIENRLLLKCSCEDAQCDNCLRIYKVLRLLDKTLTL